MNGFERRRKQKRDSILNAALELFKRQGYQKTSIAEIAELASVAQSSVYNFFNKKENLNQELIRALIFEDYAKTVNILENGDSVKIKLENLLASKANFFKNFSKHFSLKSSGEDFIKEYIDEENYQKYNNAIINLIEDGKKEGVFDNSITTQAMMTYLDIIRYYFINNPSILDNNPEFSKEIYTLFINALLKK